MSRKGSSMINFRMLVQVTFVFISIYIGWQFLNFYRYIESAGLSGSPYRPPGVEAFVPLSALVGLRAWLGTGVWDYIHPAGLTILLTAILVSFLFRKSFCSWICPFGFLEEMLSKLGAKIMPRRLKMPRWPDLILRSFKYILLSFFIGSVFFMMSAEAALGFMELPYNKLVDIMMLQFFLGISLTGMVVFGILIGLSLLFDHFWCRYLCPYGALMGLLGWVSPSRITRRENLCTNCGICDNNCSGHLKVSEAKNVVSPECNGCLKCIQKCPVPGALEFNFMGRLGGWKYLLPVIMLAVFAGTIIWAKTTGHWESEVTIREVFTLFPMASKL